jgi:hypothetical protein
MRDRKGNRIREALAVLLRVALVCALLAVGWSLYRRLPEDDGGHLPGVAAQNSATLLRIRLRRERIGFPVAEGKIPIRLYPVNLTAARNEFDSERRPGQRFEEFVVRLMGDRQPVSAELNEEGETIVALPPGRWWVHASVGTERELTWRLAVNVSGREKTVELTPDNAYTRAQRF